MNWWWYIVAVLAPIAYMVEGLLIADAMRLEGREKKLAMLMWPLVFTFLVVGFPAMFIWLLVAIPKRRC